MDNDCAMGKHDQVMQSIKTAQNTHICDVRCSYTSLPPFKKAICIDCVATLIGH